jgi:alcohol dehydrogenase class IV
MNQKLFEDITPQDVAKILVFNNAKNVFLVTGKLSFKAAGADDFIKKIKIDNLYFTQFDDFEVNPKIEDVQRGLALFKENQCDYIIAIGGGSVIDMAKCINAFQSNETNDIIDLVKTNAIKNKGVPLLAIPTTAGSGSEATHFAVIYIGNVKYSLAHPFMLPYVVGLNPKFTLSQPKYLTACAGLDALSQAIESFWNINSTPESLQYSEQAVSLIISNLKNCVLNPTLANRRSISKGAYLAGRAINITKTTAPHALSYAFTTHFSIPHGHSVFLTLPQFLIYNYDVSSEDLNDIRGVHYVRKNILRLCNLIKPNSDPYSVSEYLKSYATSLGIELSLSNLGIYNANEIVVKSVNFERLNNNPRKVSEQFLLKIF